MLITEVKHGGGALTSTYSALICWGGKRQTPASAGVCPFNQSRDRGYFFSPISSIEISRILNFWI
ncbi:MAG: hypothetical protein OQK08_08480, partial [Marinobacter sp.]|nr:hypothetical protein [Marinobacter sp.]